MRYYGYNYGYPMMGWGGWALGIVCILVIILIVFLVIRYLHRYNKRDSNHTNNPASEENTAMKILNERYARGEISEEEYKQKKSNLQS